MSYFDENHILSAAMWLQANVCKTSRFDECRRLAEDFLEQAMGQPSSFWDQKDPDSAFDTPSGAYGHLNPGDKGTGQYVWCGQLREFQVLPTTGDSLCPGCNGEGCNDFLGSKCLAEDTKVVEVKSK